MIRIFLLTLILFSGGTLAALAHPPQEGILRLSVPMAVATPFRLSENRGASTVTVEAEDFDAFDPRRGAYQVNPQVTGVRADVSSDGWEQLVIQLSEPHALAGAHISEDIPGNQVLEIDLMPIAAPSAARAAPVTRAPLPILAPDPNLPPLIVLDPGHGGIDPGATRDGLREADLMLTFSRELSEVLIRSGRFRVGVTRESDMFLRLSERVSRARALGATAFVSLHADALAEGKAKGAIVYTLSDTASDAIAADLVQAHDRADLLAGVDLSGEDDEITNTLLELARVDTQPRSDALGDAVVAAMSAQLERMHTTPRRQAGFGVLKAPDFPAILIELGFMSNKKDLENLMSEEWRAKAAAAIRDGLIDWVDADAASAALRRN